MKFSLHGKVYDVTDLDQVPLRDILLLEQQTADMGRRLTWTEVTAMGDTMAAMATDDERANFEGALWLTAVTIWAARRQAGEDLTFEQAVKFPMKDLAFIADPQDRKAPANPTKARPTTRQGSGRAARGQRAATTSARSSATTSAAESINA